MTLHETVLKLKEKFPELQIPMPDDMFKMVWVPSELLGTDNIDWAIKQDMDKEFSNIEFMKAFTCNCPDCTKKVHDRKIGDERISNKSLYEKLFLLIYNNQQGSP